MGILARQGLRQLPWSVRGLITMMPEWYAELVSTRTIWAGSAYITTHADGSVAVCVNLEIVESPCQEG